MDIDNLKKEFLANKDKYNIINRYYKGQTDSIINYQTTDRSNLKVSCNYLKKFVKEETSYSVGNPISYTSKINDNAGIEALDKVLENFKENHDIELFRAMVLFGIAYEVYFIDKNNKLGCKVLKPTEAYHKEDEEGNITGLLREYTKRVDGELKGFYDYYTEEAIFHYDENLKEIAEPTVNVLNIIPVSVARLSDELWEDTLFTDIKGLQDSLETILSDSTNEISDFRNAYLVTVGLMFDEEGQNSPAEMKKRGILSIDGTEGKVEWLIKNINDTFIQNTIKVLVEKIYELTSHINHNDSLATSNASGVALKSRLISLMQRCIFNQNSYKELLKCRIEVIFDFLAITQRLALNWEDIKITFTPCIPSDDGQIADLISKLEGKVSMKTLLSLLSFVENANEEIENVKEEGSNYSEQEFNNGQVDNE